MSVKYAQTEKGDILKLFTSPEYNYIFNTRDGSFARWGATKEEDPAFSSYGPEICDIEIVDKCKGIRDSKGNYHLCPYCYKSNTPKGSYMDVDTFAEIIDKVNKNGQLTQVALGADADCSLNPDIWKIMETCRKKGIVPNITVADVDDETADKLAKYCGAVAVSYHDNWEVFTNTVYRLTSRGMSQINCHFMLAKETLEDCYELFHRVKTDPMLKGLRAVVLLSLKKCGRAKDGPFSQVSSQEFESVMTTAMDVGIGLGFDSCSCRKFVEAIDRVKPDNIDELKMLAEPCESLLFSQYINTHGVAFPCSFNEATTPGFDMLKCEDFVEEYWNNSTAADGWRTRLLKNNRACPTYDI